MTRSRCPQCGADSYASDAACCRCGAPVAYGRPAVPGVGASRPVDGRPRAGVVVAAALGIVFSVGLGAVGLVLLTRGRL